VDLASLVVLGHAVAASGLAWVYFRCFALTRPPIGRFSLADVAFLLGSIVVVPLVYLVVPGPVLAGLLAIGAIGALHLLSEPVLRARWLTWMAVLGLGGAEAGLYWSFGPADPSFLMLRNGLTVLTAVAVANLWAQSGLRARDAAILGGALAVYDLVATSWLPLMGLLLERTADLPFAPVVVWPSAAGGEGVGLGLGDLLLLAVFPLVLRRAYGRGAGLIGLGLGLAGLVGVFGLVSLGAVTIFPVMVVLGPLMALQYCWWSRRIGPERTTWRYLQAEPLTPEPT
jgi:hypothetical protein